jgi:hypothetical protein
MTAPSAILVPPTRGNYCAKNRLPRQKPARPLQPDEHSPKKRKGNNASTCPLAPLAPLPIQETGDNLAAIIQHPLHPLRPLRPSVTFSPPIQHPASSIIATLSRDFCPLNPAFSADKSHPTFVTRTPRQTPRTADSAAHAAGQNSRLLSAQTCLHSRTKLARRQETTLPPSSSIMNPASSIPSVLRELCALARDPLREHRSRAQKLAPRAQKLVPRDQNLAPSRARQASAGHRPASRGGRKEKERKVGAPRLELGTSALSELPGRGVFPAFSPCSTTF